MNKFYRIVFQLILLLLSIGTLASCEKKDKDLVVNERISIDLMETDEYAVFEKTMILFEDQQYTVKTPVSFFIQGYGEVDYTGYLQKINTISGDAQKKTVLYIKDYFDEVKQPYLLAHFLENGKCYGWDNTKEVQIVLISDNGRQSILYKY